MKSFASRLRTLAVVVVAAAGFSAGFVAPASAAPLEAYGRLPLIEDVDISDDGTMVAMTTTDGEIRRVVIKRLSDNAVLGAIKTGDRKVLNVSWAGPENVIITTVQLTVPKGIEGPPQEFRMALVYNIRTKKQRGLMDGVQNALNVVAGRPVIRILDGEVHVVVEGFHMVDGRGRIGLFRIRLRDFETKLIAPGLQFTRDWVVGADGEPIAQTEYEPKTGEWRLRLRDGRSWILADSKIYPFYPPSLGGLGTTERSVLLYVSEDDDTTTVREYTLGAVPRDLIRANSFEAVFTDGVPQTLAGIGVSSPEGPQYTFYDPSAEKAWKSVVKSFPGDQVDFWAWSDGFRQVAVSVDSPKLGLALSLIDLEKKSGSWLGSLYDLTEEDISPVQNITYNAADGLQITGVLTLPRGVEAKGLPLVVLPNRGLGASTEAGFDWWAQALASRGYAVLRPNPRGTMGLGAALDEAGFGQVGRKRETDLSDGACYLASQGLIDLKRVCIVGAGYGGYSALAGVTLETGVYRCGVSVGGVFDLKSRLLPRVSGGYISEATVRILSRIFGVTGPKDPALATISPINFADRVTAPVLLIHAKDDVQFPYGQSKAMFDALTSAGKRVDLVTLEGEDHSLSRGDTRLQMLKAVVAFLEEHNPPN